MHFPWRQHGGAGSSRYLPRFRPQPLRRRHESEKLEPCHLPRSFPRRGSLIELGGLRAVLLLPVGALTVHNTRGAGQRFFGCLRKGIFGIVPSILLAVIG